MKTYEERTGYACINMTLSQKGIMTNRDCIQRSFKSKGLAHISQLALANVNDLEKIVKWNSENGFNFYRVSSGLFPWMTEYEFEDLPDWSAIKKKLREIGEFVTKVGQRLEFHPNHFTVLASPNSKTVIKSLKDLEQHSRIFDEMGLKPSHWNCINIHVGGAYGDKKNAAARWCENFKHLSDNCKKRIVLENDDKAKMYSVMDLYQMIYKKTHVPITFDVFHHGFCDGGLSTEEAATLAAKTWQDAPMVIHWSSSKRDYEDPKAKSVAHADYIYEDFNDWGTQAWIMSEAKAKELSILEYRRIGPRKVLVIEKS